jgi:F-type H+-transporting ATPase subunit c
MKSLMTLVLFLVALPAFAAEGSDAAAFAMSAAAAITIAAVGGAIAQGKAASVALEGIARNPAASDKLFTPMIIALALIESLVIYAFVIAFLIKP